MDALLQGALILIFAMIWLLLGTLSAVVGRDYGYIGHRGMAALALLGGPFVLVWLLVRLALDPEN